jgi:hypothetical protein
VADAVKVPGQLTEVAVADNNLECQYRPSRKMSLIPLECAGVDLAIAALTKSEEFLSPPRVLMATRLVALSLFFVCVASVASARADSIGPNCGTCQGSIYTLTNLGLVTDLVTGDALVDTWRIVLTIDTTGYTGKGVRIDEVALKVSSGLDGARLVSAPGGTAQWNLMLGGLNANGCSGAGSGFDCATFTGSTGGAVVPGTVLTWTFDLDVRGPLLIGAQQSSIKARYVDAAGNKVGALVSENITLGAPPPPPPPVPESSSLLLLGPALPALVFLARRRR